MNSEELLGLTSDISPDLDSDDSMCWSDESIDLTAESNLETAAGSDLNTAASTQNTDSGQLPCESQPDWAFESEEWKQPLYSGAQITKFDSFLLLVQFMLRY